MVLAPRVMKTPKAATRGFSDPIDGGIVCFKLQHDFNITCLNDSESLKAGHE